MSFSISHLPTMPPYKRRTATSVMAGDFDTWQDTSTSPSNGVGSYKVVTERDAETRRNEKKEKQERERKAEQATAGPSNVAVLNPANILPTPVPVPATATSSLWPPPSSAQFTPEPCVASTLSQTTSKMPYTPSDHTDQPQPEAASSATLSSRPRNKRTAVRKGWKGWVEASPPPSDKLISLDTLTVLPGRRTRNGKSFDAIGFGKDGWV